MNVRWEIAKPIHQHPRKNYTEKSRRDDDYLEERKKVLETKSLEFEKRLAALELK